MSTRLGWWATAAGVLIGAGLVRIGYVLHALSARWVNEDSAAVLLAAQELLRLRVHQPSFPGQHYGVVFEGVPAAAAALAGLPPMLGLAGTLALLWYGAWLLLAAGAWHAGARLSALLAAGAPLVLSVYPVYYSSFFTTGAGRFLAVAAAVLLWRGRLVHVGVGLALLAFVFDPSTVVLPLAAVLLGGREVVGAVRRAPWRVAAACLPAVAWAAWRTAFAARHPDHGLHAAPSTDPSWQGLTTVVDRSAHYASSFAFEAVPGGEPVLVVGLLLLVACLLLGDLRIRLASLAVSGMTALVAATPRALDDVSMFLPGSRVFLAVPYAVLLLVAALEARIAADRPRAQRVLVAAAGVVLAVSAVAALVRWDTEVEVIAQAAPTAPIVALVPVGELEQRCRLADELARGAGTDLVVYLDDRPAAYGCPVLADTAHETLLPSYERRTWRLYDEQAAVHERLAVVGDAGLCGAAAVAGIACRAVEGPLPAVVVQPAGRTTLDLLRQLGVAVRPFGPGCSPPRPETCQSSGTIGSPTSMAPERREGAW